MPARNDKPAERKISRVLHENVDVLNKELGVGKSFDMVCRELNYGGTDFALYFIDGFARDMVMNQIMEYLGQIKPEQFTVEEIKKLCERYIGYLQVDVIDNLDDVELEILSGPLVFLVDGEVEAVSIDAKEFPGRGPEEPDLERVVRGSRDGFVETLTINTALTRRRVRDPGLRFEQIKVGRRSKTDVCVTYIEDIANPDLVELIKNKISEIEIDGLPMAEKTLEELVFERNWNPYPMVRYTERPDVASVHLFEGHVLVYVDTSPSVMITPTTFFHHLQHAAEFRNKPIIGLFVRWLRFVAVLASIVVSPLWMAMAKATIYMPHWLAFTMPTKSFAIPIFWQFAAAEFGLGLLRMASVHTPNPLGAALGLVAALMVGDVAINVGFFSEQVILFTSISAIGTFATPSYELSMANQLVRIVLLVLTGVFSFWGFIAGVVLWLVLLMSTKSLNTPYFWPVWPLHPRALLHVIMRPPVDWSQRRPSFLHVKDKTRR